MNIYPAWWNTTVTIFNKYVDDTTDEVLWFSHKVENCFWKYTGNKVNINDNIIETNDIICRIPKDERFKENYEWLLIPADEKGDYFTLNKGDIIVKGDVSDIVDEYDSGKRSSDLIKKYKDLQGCLVVTKFTINTEGGRCSEHYYVKGE